MASNGNEWFLPSDGIDRSVIEADIKIYLGPDVTVRPGIGTGQHATARGFWIKSERRLTNRMVEDLKNDTRRWYGEEEQSANRWKTRSSVSPSTNSTPTANPCSSSSSTTTYSSGYGYPSSMPSSGRSTMESLTTSSEYTTTPAHPGGYYLASDGRQYPLSQLPQPYRSNSLGITTPFFSRRSPAEQSSTYNKSSLREDHFPGHERPRDSTTNYHYAQNTQQVDLGPGGIQEPEHGTEPDQSLTHIPGDETGTVGNPATDPSQGIDGNTSRSEDRARGNGTLEESTARATGDHQPQPASELCDPTIPADLRKILNSTQTQLSSSERNEFGVISSPRENCGRAQTATPSRVWRDILEKWMSSRVKSSVTPTALENLLFPIILRAILEKLTLNFYYEAPSTENCPSDAGTGNHSGSTSARPSESPSRKRARNSGCGPPASIDEYGANNGEEDEDSNGGDQKRRKTGPSSSSVVNRLRCPFYTNDPEKYKIQGACSSGYGFKDMGKLRQHILRTHVQPRNSHRCHRCQDDFPSEEQLEEHLRQEEVCQKRDKRIDGLMSFVKWEAIERSRTFNSNRHTAEDKWQVLYKALFPSDTRQHSPYDGPIMIHQLEHPLIESIREEILEPLDPTLFVLLEEVRKRMPAILQRCKQKLRTPTPASLPTLTSDRSSEPQLSSPRGTPSFRSMVTPDETSLPISTSPHSRNDKGKAPIRNLTDSLESSNTIFTGSVTTQTPPLTAQILDPDILNSLRVSAAPSLATQSFNPSFSTTEDCIFNSTMETINCLPNLGLLPSAGCFTELFQDVTIMPDMNNREDQDVTDVAEWLILSSWIVAR